MTFIPLTYKNFVVNKVKNTLDINYKDSDVSTHVCNKSFESKSLININNFNNLTNEECLLEDNDVDLIAKKNQIKTFYSNVSNENLTALDYFSSKDTLNSQNIFNDNIKEFNFKNYYKIDRVEQKFLPNSFELQKKNIVKNSLYHDYRSNYSLDFYKELKKGFCNYNTINFFSQQYENDSNHTNCIIWPNTKTANGNLYNIINNSFTFSCYLNLRKNYSTSKEPECLFHVPDLVSIYIVKSIGVTNTNHRVAIVAGKNCKREI